MHARTPLGDIVSELPALLGNDKDHLCTRTSYKLDLRGPSLTVQSACSTGLVAVHAACQSLLGYQCDLALAGAVSLTFPLDTGYLHQPGNIASPDGHCRAFDARAEGAVGGDGVGVVALKRLSEALADGDHVHAVILGVAINNDGAAKVGYAAPSLDGQAEVIALADAVGSTSAILKAAQTMDAQEFIVATDNGMMHKLRTLNPGKVFYEAPTAGNSATCKSCAHCPWMAMNGLADVARVLETGANAVHVDPALIPRARMPIDRMLAFTAALRSGQPVSGDGLVIQPGYNLANSHDSAFHFLAASSSRSKKNAWSKSFKRNSASIMASCSRIPS